MNFLFQSNLTPIEHHISKTIYENADKIASMSIMDVAKLCNVSNSKITKYSYKLGFDGFKELKYVINNSLLEPADNSMTITNQIDIIQKFFTNLDKEVMDELITVIDKYDSIILYGDGASFEVAKYFEDRLSFATRKPVMVYENENLLYSYLASNKSNPLLLVLSASGKSSNTLKFIDHAWGNAKDIVLITESIMNNPKTIMTINLLSQEYSYDQSVMRSRSLFMLYLEFLVQEILNNKNC